jgi:hypothetical protein
VCPAKVNEVELAFPQESTSMFSLPQAPINQSKDAPQCNTMWTLKTSTGA